MRFLVTADLHVNQTSRSVWDAEAGLPASQVEALGRVAEIVQIAQQEKVDAILIGGDLFDDGLPTPHIVELMRQEWRKLPAHIRVYIAGGNHEHRGLKAGEYGPLEVYLANEPWCGGVFTTMGTIDIEGFQVVMAPWWQVAGTDSLATDSHALENAIIEQGEKVTQPALFVGHLTVAEADFRNTKVRSAENLIRDSILEALVPAQVLEDGPWSAALLGHIHRAQSFGAKTRYVGSTYPISFGESEGKSVEIIDIEEDGTVNHRQVELEHRLMDTIDLTGNQNAVTPYAFRTLQPEEYRKGDILRIVLNPRQTLTREESDQVASLQDSGVRIFTRHLADTESKQSINGQSASAKILGGVSSIADMTAEDSLTEYLGVLPEQLPERRKNRIRSLFETITHATDTGQDIDSQSLVPTGKDQSEE